jgi:DNA-binding transcriptional LysR family regulator
VIRNLESELGERLLDRSSRDGSLTDAGQLLQEYAQELLNLRNEARLSLVELRQMQKGKLSIAANEYTSLYLLRVLREFRRVHPMIHIAVQRSLASKVAQNLQEHAAELGMLSFRPEEAHLRSVLVYRDQLAFIVPPKHALASASQVSIRELGAEVFVAHNVPSPYRAKVLQAFARHKTPLHMEIQLPTIESIKKFVAIGNGVALVPSLAVEDEIARGELVSVPVPELSFERRLRLVHRRQGTLSHAARAFLQVAESLSRSPGGRYLFQPEH